MKIPEHKNFEKTINSHENRLFCLRNAAGMQAYFTNYGLRLVSLFKPDARGILADVVLGFDSIDAYLQGPEWFFGATVGRFANRIANSQFCIDGKILHLKSNDGPHQLHGGKNGFHTAMFVIHQPAENQLVATYFSPAGEAGFSGNLKLTVTILLTDTNELQFRYMAKTDAPTVVNFTHHSYFNLAGQGSGNVLSHLLQIAAKTYTVCTDDGLPTGELRTLQNSPLDFSTAKKIGAAIFSAHPEIARHAGFDQNYVNANFAGDAVVLNAEVLEEESGRRMRVFSNQPGLQLFTANRMDGSIIGKGGLSYPAFAGFCLEPQNFPNAPNVPHFPNAILRPGEVYSKSICYCF